MLHFEWSWPWATLCLLIVSGFVVRVIYAVRGIPMAPTLLVEFPRKEEKKEGK